MNNTTLSLLLASCLIIVHPIAATEKQLESNFAKPPHQLTMRERRELKLQQAALSSATVDTLAAPTPTLPEALSVSLEPHSLLTSRHIPRPSPASSAQPKSPREKASNLLKYEAHQATSHPTEPKKLSMREKKELAKQQQAALSSATADTLAAPSPTLPEALSVSLEPHSLLTSRQKSIPLPSSPTQPKSPREEASKFEAHQATSHPTEPKKLSMREKRELAMQQQAARSSATADTVGAPTPTIPEALSVSLEPHSLLTPRHIPRPSPASPAQSKSPREEASKFETHQSTSHPTEPKKLSMREKKELAMQQQVARSSATADTLAAPTPTIPEPLSVVSQSQLRPQISHIPSLSMAPSPLPMHPRSRLQDSIALQISDHKLLSHSGKSIQIHSHNTMHHCVEAETNGFGIIEQLDVYLKRLYNKVCPGISEVFQGPGSPHIFLGQEISLVIPELYQPVIPKLTKMIRLHLGREVKLHASPNLTGSRNQHLVTFWLEDQFEQVLPATSYLSEFWDKFSPINKTPYEDRMLYTFLKNKTTGEYIAVVNVHLLFQNPPFYLYDSAYFQQLANFFHREAMLFSQLGFRMIFGGDLSFSPALIQKDLSRNFDVTIGAKDSSITYDSMKPLQPRLQETDLVAIYRGPIGEALPAISISSQRYTTLGTKTREKTVGNVRAPMGSLYRPYADEFVKGMVACDTFLNDFPISFATFNWPSEDQNNFMLLLKKGDKRAEKDDNGLDQKIETSSRIWDFITTRPNSVFALQGCLEEDYEILSRHYLPRSYSLIVASDYQNLIIYNDSKFHCLTSSANDLDSLNHLGCDPSDTLALSSGYYIHAQLKHIASGNILEIVNVNLERYANPQDVAIALQQIIRSNKNQWVFLGNFNTGLDQRPLLGITQLLSVDDSPSARSRETRANTSTAIIYSF